MLAAASCQLQPPPKAKELPLQTEKSAPAASQKFFAAPEPARTVRFSFEKSLALALASPPCKETDQARAKLEVSFPITSYFGEHQAKLTLATTPAGELVETEIEGRKLRFTSASPLREVLFTRGCAALASSPDANEAAVTLDAKEHAVVRQWAELIAPDCKLDAAPTGFFCNLPDVDAVAAQQELIGVRSTMIRSWSRQPYLISRRVAVGIALAAALQSDSEKELDKFCTVAKRSLPKELPATLASARWLAGACTPGMPYRKLAAQFGLAKTLTEIDMVRQLFERTSKLGSLAVRIPESATQARNFLVSLTPGPDVTEALTREAAKLVAESNPTAAAGVLPGACWHPVFAENPTLLRLARNLAMAGDALHVDCDDGAESAKLADATQAYFAESLTSETEFVVGNGRATTLRLPVGNYSYSLRSLPDDAEAWDDAAQAESGSKGEIVWDTRRPRPVIATW